MAWTGWAGSGYRRKYPRGSSLLRGIQRGDGSAFFGAERRGAPVIASNRFGWEPVKTFSLVNHPDVVVVLDETLLKVVNVAAGVRPDGIVIVNTTKAPKRSTSRPLSTLPRPMPPAGQRRLV